MKIQARSWRGIEWRATKMNSTEVAALLDNPDCDIKARHVTASDGYQLRVYSFTPKQASDLPPVVFIPGWTSVMDGWAPLLSLIHI